MINFPEEGPVSFEALKSFIESKVGQYEVPDQSLILMFGSMENNGFFLKNQEFDVTGAGQGFIAPHKFSEVLGGSGPAREEGFKFGAHEATIELYPAEEEAYGSTILFLSPLHQKTRKISLVNFSSSSAYEENIHGINFEIKYTYTAEDLLINRGELYQYSRSWNKRNATINTPSIENIDQSDLFKYFNIIEIVRSIGRTINKTGDQNSESGIFYEFPMPLEISAYMLRWEEFYLYNLNEPNRVRLGYSPFGGEIFDSAEEDVEIYTDESDFFAPPYIYKDHFAGVILNPEDAKKIFITISQTGKSSPAIWWQSKIHEFLLPASQHNVMAEVEVDLYNTPDFYYDAYKYGSLRRFYIPENCYIPMLNTSINEEEYWLSEGSADYDGSLEFINVKNQNKRIIASQQKVKDIDDFEEQKGSGSINDYKQTHTVGLHFLESLHKTFAVDIVDNSDFHSGYNNNLFYTNIIRDLPSDLEGYDSKESTVIYCQLKPYQELNIYGEFSYTGHGSVVLNLRRKTDGSTGNLFDAEGEEDIIKMIRAKLTRLSRITAIGSTNPPYNSEQDDFFDWMFSETISSLRPAEHFKLITPDFEENYPAENFDEVFLEHFNNNLMIPSNGNQRESWIGAHFLWAWNRFSALVFSPEQLEDIFKIVSNYSERLWIHDTLTPRFSPEKLFNIQTSFFTDLTDEAKKYLDDAIEYVNSVILDKKDFSLRFIPYQNSQAGGTLAAARPDFYQKVGKLTNVQREQIFDLEDFYIDSGDFETKNLIIHPSTGEITKDIEIELTGDSFYSAEFVCEIGVCEEGTLYDIHNSININDNHFFTHKAGYLTAVVHILETTEDNKKKPIVFFDQTRTRIVFVAETTGMHYLKFQLINDVIPEDNYVTEANLAPRFTQQGWEASDKWKQPYGTDYALIDGNEYDPLYHTFEIKDSVENPYRNESGLISGISYKAKIYVESVSTGSIIFGTANFAGNGISVGYGRGIRISEPGEYEFIFEADPNRPSIGVVGEGITRCWIEDIKVFFEYSGYRLLNGEPDDILDGIASSQVSPRVGLTPMQNNRIKCDRRISIDSAAFFMLSYNVAYNNGYVEEGDKILIKDSIYTISGVEEKVDGADYFGYKSTAGYTFLTVEEEVDFFESSERPNLLKIFPIRRRNTTEGVTSVSMGLSISKFNGNSFPGVPCGTVFLDQIDLHARSSAHEINDGRNAIFNVIVHEILHAIGVSSTIAARNGFVTKSYPSSCTIDVVNEKYKDTVSQKIYQLGLDINDFYIDSLPMESGGAHVAEYAKLNNNKIQAAFQNDIMSPLYDFDRAIITPVTLSLIEGYLGYNVDYSLADGINLLELHIDTSVSNTSGSSSYDTIRTCSCCFHDEKIQINSDAKINNSIDIKRAT